MSRVPGRRRLWARAVGGATVLLSVRWISLAWGATGVEQRAALAGDDLLSSADLCATRAITIRAPADEVWPWIAQLGQGRGGFYSYDLLENLLGCDIHSADRIVAEWQSVKVGDPVNLYPEVGLTVVHVDPARALVLRGGIPGRPDKRSPYDFTWAFVLRPASAATTRLVVRERYAYAHWWVVLLVEPVEMLSFVMSRRMLHGIKDRAEHAQER